MTSQGSTVLLTRPGIGRNQYSTLGKECMWVTSWTCCAVYCHVLCYTFKAEYTASLSQAFGLIEPGVYQAKLDWRIRTIVSFTCMYACKNYLMHGQQPNHHQLPVCYYNTMEIDNFVEVCAEVSDGTCTIEAGNTYLHSSCWNIAMDNFHWYAWVHHIKLHTFEEPEY